MATDTTRESETGRARHGKRRRCSDPEGTGCTHFARRGTVPPVCTYCGGGTRAEKKHEIDPDSGEQKTTQRNLIRVPDKIVALLDGTISVKDLDDEELAHGYPRAADGTFRGAPTVVPRSLHQRMVRELFERANQKMKDRLIDVASAMADMATNPEYDPAVRLKAGQWVMERMMGKTPDVVVNVEEKRYEKMFDRIDRDAIVIDGEVMDDGREP